jgi:hypothetical protein
VKIVRRLKIVHLTAKIVNVAKIAMTVNDVKIRRSDSENCKEAKNSHEKGKKESEPNIEQRNRKDMHIDQYGD